MTSPDNTPLVGLSDADIMRMGVAALLRIAAALEAEATSAPPKQKPITYDLADYPNFDWSAIGYTVLGRDQDGATMVRMPDGVLLKRGANAKFGNDIWFRYSDGKDENGDVRYVHVVKFSEIKPPEPLDNRIRSALAKPASKPEPATVEPQKPADPPVSGRFASPLMEPILKRWKALALEAGQLGQADIPSRFILQPSLAVPECQHRTDELDQFVAGLRMAKADHAPARETARVETNEPSPLEAARRWHASAPRVSADNRGQLMEELQAHLRKLPACKIDLAKLSAQARMDEFGGWLKAQAVPA